MSDDDWETDPDFENDVTEEEQRYGAKTIGFARTDIDMKALADSTKEVRTRAPVDRLHCSASLRMASRCCGQSTSQSETTPYERGWANAL